MDIAYHPVRYAVDNGAALERRFARKWPLCHAISPSEIKRKKVNFSIYDALVERQREYSRFGVPCWLRIGAPLPWPAAKTSMQSLGYLGAGSRFDEREPPV